MAILFSDLDIKVNEVLPWTLHESINQYPVLQGVVRIDPTSKDRLGVIGGHIMLEMPKLPWLSGVGVGATFKGFVTRARLRGNRLWFTAFAESGRRDLVRRTRSIGTAEEPRPFHELEGAEGLLRGVDGAKSIDVKMPLFWQVNESDFSTLVRAAAMARHFVIGRLDGRIAVVKASDGKSRPLDPELIVEGSEQYDMSLRPPDIECLTWDPIGGEARRNPAKGRADGLTGIAADHLTRLSEAFGQDQVPNNFPACFGLVLDDPQRAEGMARAEFARSWFWQADLLDPTVVPGDLLKFADGHPIDSTVRILSRTLRYDPNAPPAYQITNTVIASHGSMSPVSGPPTTSGSLTWMVGQIARVDDSQRQARVKVRFPWHSAVGNDPANWEGLWCLTTQTFGGTDAQGRNYGSIVVPAPLDWCLALFDPSGCEPPLVLTVLYRGQKAKVPAQVSLPEIERLLLATPGGISILARDQKGGQPGALIFAIRDAQGKEIAAIEIRTDGTIRIKAKRIDANGKLDINPDSQSS